MLPEIRPAPVWMCVLARSACACVWPFFSMCWKMQSFLKISTLSKLHAYLLKSKRERGGLTCQQFTITVSSAQRFNRSTPLDDSQMNHCIQRRGDYRHISLNGKKKKEVQLHVSCKIGVICSAFFFVKRSLRTLPADNETYGYMARWPPQSRDALEKHTSLHMSLSQWLFVWQGELFMPPEQREYITMYSAASKFCFLWAALFLEHIYKQKLVCRQWISSLRDRTGLGSGRFCVLPMLTLAWEKLKLL